MFNEGNALAMGPAQLMAAYDTAAANAMAGGNSAMLNLGTQSSMLPYLSNQATTHLGEPALLRWLLGGGGPTSTGTPGM